MKQATISARDIEMVLQPLELGEVEQLGAVIGRIPEQFRNLKSLLGHGFARDVCRRGSEQMPADTGDFILEGDDVWFALVEAATIGMTAPIAAMQNVVLLLIATLHKSQSDGESCPEFNPLLN